MFLVEFGWIQIDLHVLTLLLGDDKMNGNHSRIESQALGSTHEILPFEAAVI